MVLASKRVFRFTLRIFAMLGEALTILRRYFHCTIPPYIHRPPTHLRRLGVFLKLNLVLELPDSRILEHLFRKPVRACWLTHQYQGNKIGDAELGLDHILWFVQSHITTYVLLHFYNNLLHIFCLDAVLGGNCRSSFKSRTDKPA